MTQPTLSIIIPAHNEAGNIHPLVQEIMAVATQIPLREIIYVNDGSTDSTLSDLKKTKESYPLVRILNHSTKSGQSTAMITAARAATGDLIVTLDGDGQNDPADIPGLYATYIQAITTNPRLGMVAGQRVRAQFSGFRRLSSWIANRIRAALLQDTIRGACSMRLIRRDVYLRLPYFNHMHRFMVALVLREGFDVIAAPVHHRPRRLGTTKYTTLNRALVGIVDLLGVMWLQSRAPKTLEIEEIT